MDKPIISTVLDTTSDSGRSVEVTTLGRLTRTADEATPYGIDANPIAGMQVVFMDTVNANSPVVVGYLNTSALAEQGELRLYATDADGAEQVRIWLHADGTIELGGTGAAGSNTNHGVQYEALKVQFDQLKTDFNNLVTVFNNHTHLIPVYTAPVGAPAPTPPTAMPATPTAADITPSKLANILVQ